jgi:DNA-directed RNA polymerase subunit RPC12/RpoP
MPGVSVPGTRMTAVKELAYAGTPGESKQWLGRARQFAMKAEYACLKCEIRFTIEVTESESRSSLESGRTDACPQCAQPVGTGSVRCKSCGHTFELAFPHWHVHCDVANGPCPACGAHYASLCIC